MEQEPGAGGHGGIGATALKICVTFVAKIFCIANETALIKIHKAESSQKRKTPKMKNWQQPNV